MVNQPTPQADGEAAGDVEAPPVDALRELVLQHYQDVYRYAFRLAGSQADAEDLTQQAFLIAHRKLDQLRQPDRLKSWLFAILRSCFLKACRRSVPLTGQQVAVDEMPDRAVDESSIDDEQLQVAIQSLPAEFKVVLLMFYFEQLSYQEIADALEIPTGTVMSRLSRAKGRLRHRLLATGGGPERAAGDMERDSFRTMMSPLDGTSWNSGLPARPQRYTYE